MLATPPLVLLLDATADNSARAHRDHWMFASSVRRAAAAAGGAGGARPFKVLGLQQVAIGGKKSALSQLWVNTFGCTKTGTFRSERENVDEDILTLGKGPFAVEVDLMEPINPDKVRARRVARGVVCGRRAAMLMRRAGGVASSRSLLGALLLTRARFCNVCSPRR
jgi:hypothetical protein